MDEKKNTKKKPENPNEPRKPREKAKMYAVVVTENNTLHAYELADKDRVATFVTEKVATEIKDGMCKMNDGKGCMFVIGKVFSPKIRTTVSY